MKKFIKYLYTIIPLIIVAFLGYKYVKDPDSFLQKKDVEKAKQKIKDAGKSTLKSKDLRRKTNSEVMKLQAKSKVRHSEFKKSVETVEELEKLNDELEDSQESRNITAGDLLKRRKND